MKDKCVTSRLLLAHLHKTIVNFQCHCKRHLGWLHSFIYTHFIPRQKKKLPSHFMLQNGRNIIFSVKIQMRHFRILLITVIDDKKKGISRVSVIKKIEKIMSKSRKISKTPSNHFVKKDPIFHYFPKKFHFSVGKKAHQFIKL